MSRLTVSLVKNETKLIRYFISLISRGMLRLKPTGSKERGTRMATLRRLVLSLRPRRSARSPARPLARPPSLGRRLWRMKRGW